MNVDDVARLIAAAAVQSEKLSAREWRCSREDLPGLAFSVRVTRDAVVLTHVLQRARPPLTEGEAETLLFACGALNAIKMVANESGTSVSMVLEWPLKYMDEEFLVFTLEEFLSQVDYVRHQLPQFADALNA